MTRRESLMVRALAVVLAVAAAGTAFALQVQRRAETRGRIATMEGELVKLRGRGADIAALRGQRDLLSAERSRELSRIDRGGIMDAYHFGTIVRSLLMSEGLEIGRYRTLESSGRTYLEFTVSGSAPGMARFLQRVTDSEHVWVMPVLSIDAHDGSGALRSVFRIGYETIVDVAR